MDGVPACSQIQCQLFCLIINIAMGNNFKHSHVQLANYTIFPVLELDLDIQALLLDYIIALEKYTRTSCVHLVFIYRNQYF